MIKESDYVRDDGVSIKGVGKDGKPYQIKPFCKICNERFVTRHLGRYLCRRCAGKIRRDEDGM